jgi:hypothetical protein
MATVVDAINERIADTFPEKYIERTHIHPETCTASAAALGQKNPQKVF